jgi:hypothetical protein
MTQALYAHMNNKTIKKINGGHDQIHSCAKDPVPAAGQ